MPSTQVLDVEDLLLADEQLWKSKRFHFARQRDMRTVLRYLTRSEVMSLWSDALSLALDQREASDTQHTILCFHSSLYAARRNEHFSTTSLAIADPRLQDVDRVVTLIDDIFDMWSRLGGQSTDLFHQASWLRRRLEAQDLDELVQYDHGAQTLSYNDLTGSLLGLDAKSYNRVVIDSSVSILNQILNWRHLDMIQGEALATALSAELTVLGVKHPAAALESLVKSPAAKTSYLSHPISRPRRTYLSDSTGGWPDVVRDSNELSSRFATHGIVLVCPTAIDEFRLSQPLSKRDAESGKKTFPEGLHRRKFALTERWPLLTAQEESLNSTSAPDSRLVHCDLANVDDDLDFEGVSTRTLESLIYSEVPFRDHFLVNHTNAFLVYRPLYEEGSFSAGVRNEITHWQASYGAGEINRRALYVHSPNDVADLCRIIRGASQSQLGDRFRTDVFHRLSDHGIPANLINQILSSGASKAEMLDTEFFEEGMSIVELVDEAYEEVGRTALFSEMTALPKEFYECENVAIAGLRDEAASNSEIGAMATFLDGTTYPDSDLFDIYNAISRHIGMSISTWTQSGFK